MPAASASTLDTLAAALAEAGRYDDAVAAADRALDMAGSRSGDLAAEIAIRRALCAAGRAFWDPSVGPQTGSAGKVQQNLGGIDATQS